MSAALNSAEGQDLYLLGALAVSAERAGLVTGPDQVYDFTVAPVLGGRIEVSNVGVIGFVVV